MEPEKSYIEQLIETKTEINRKKRLYLLNPVRKVITKTRKEEIKKIKRNRSSKRSHRKHDRIFKEEFKKLLILRILSRPVDRKYEGIELARRIIQLMLLHYRITFTKKIISDIIGFCCSQGPRNHIIQIEDILIGDGIGQDIFIYFCWWYLKIFPAGGIFKALKWITTDSIFSMKKYKINEPDIFNTAFNFTNNTERGKKLIRLIQVNEEQKVDHIFERIKNL